MFLFVFNIDGADLVHGVSPTFKFVDYCAKKKKKKKTREMQSLMIIPDGKEDLKNRTL